MLTDWIDQEELAETWHEITYDSYIVDVRRVRKTKAEGYSKAVAEVCKYALKFSDLSTENTWHAFLSLKGKRLTGSFGSMHGVKILIQPHPMTSQAKNCRTWRCYIVLCLARNPITT